MYRSTLRGDAADRFSSPHIVSDPISALPLYDVVPERECHPAAIILLYDGQQVVEVSVEHNCHVTAETVSTLDEEEFSAK